MVEKKASDSPSGRKVGHEPAPATKACKCPFVCLYISGPVPLK
jgi:hypothetical protein